MTQKLETLTVHAGCEPDPTTNARITPIYQTASYVFDSPEHAANLFALKEFGNIYTRIMNPTNAALEGKIAALEGGAGALAVASGHAAQFLTFHTLMEPGCEIVAAKKLYGGSLNQLGHSFKKMAWHTNFVDADNADNVAAAINDKTRAVFIESLANPGGVVQDIEAIAKVAHDAGVPLIVDNTMASPALCRPIEHGADIVVHSTTKFLNGHGNAIGGVIVDAAQCFVSRRGAERGRGADSLHHRLPCAWLARSGASTCAYERVPCVDRYGDANAAHGTALQQRDGAC
jgi:O-acetylhomoserine (thiol)-lyase